MFIGFLHLKELFSRVNASERLTSRELQLFFDRIVFNAITVASKGNGFLVRVLRFNCRLEERSHADFYLDVGQEFLRFFSLFQMLRLCEVIKRASHKF